MPMNDSLIFDSWVSYGPRPGKDPEERWTLDHLLSDLDFYGIAGAVVRHNQMQSYDAMHINNRLSRELASYRDRLFPCWAVLPHQFGDFPSPNELIHQMDDNDIRAVYFQPLRDGYPIHENILNPLAQVLNPRKMPILVSIADLANDYETAIQFSRIFHACPIVLGETNWGQWRLVLSIMDACPNIHLEFHFLQANRAVEFLAQRYGPNRLLFGSGLLKHSAGAARGFIDWSLMDERSIAKFASENLRSLLGTGPASPAPFCASDDLILAAHMKKPLPALVLDAHCHVLDEGLNGAGGPYVMIRGDVKNMFELTRRMGIQKTAMMSWSGTVCMDVEAGNTLIENIVDQFPDEVIGVSSCDPTHQSPEQIRATCRHLHDEKGFRGMKPYPTNHLSYADPRYAPYWEFGDEQGLYALLHVDPLSGGLQAVSELADRYKRMRFLIAHVGGSWEFARQSVEVIKKFPNVMAELTLTPVPNGIIEWLCREVGADRVLFGTDAPMRDPRPQLGWCVFTRLPLKDKKKILGENFARILQK